MLVKKSLEYRDQDITFKGYVVFDDAIKNKRPLVLVSPDWSGCNDFARNKAEKIAELGYVGFAIDLYGKGETGENNEEKMELMKPLMDDRTLLQRRILAAFNFAKQLEQVDTKRTAAIGFCFGGLCVLDLARAGADIMGVVSFHGLLSPPSHGNKTIKAKILVLHGHDDPMVTPDAVLAFEREMTEADVDWQLHIFGKTKHGFTNPLANDPKIGTAYSKCADMRSWIVMKDFLEEVFVMPACF